jgi:hypothetical protein
MLDIKFDQASVNRLKAVLDKGPQLLQPSLLDGMRRIGLGIESHVKGKLRGQVLKARTGTLSRAVFSRTQATGDGDVMVVVGVDSAKAPYGRIHEVGGIIRPRRAANLAIPIGEAKTRGGVARFSARQLVQNPRAFGYTGAFFRKNVLFGNRNRVPVPLFVLKPQVAIKGTGYLSGSIEEKRPWALGELGRAIAKALKSIFPNG